ncbi:hypothetical protein BKA83DRAFT_90507 [Pisolithus microcarpus]|nr:hypothetical protein BKA83DRAFT_90507 [Pisolithus microcarpus]
MWDICHELLQQTAVDYRSWRYSQTMVMDGNFKEHMKEWQPHDQVWLMDGQAYMVTNPEYHEYLKATPHITEKSTCNNHKALSHPNADRGKLNLTGIGATACVWHRCFYPHSVVDSQKGESSHIQIPSSIWIVPGISIWHMHRHKKECYMLNSPLFIKGAGWVDGEIIKTLWSMLNLVSASACSMSSPHQQELSDFQMNDSNFIKMINQVDSLSRKLKATCASVALARKAFTELDATVSPTNKQLWKSQEDAALHQRVDDCTVIDIFETQRSKGLL